MKKIRCFVILLVLIPLFSMAQDAKSKIHEVGINFSNLNSFGIRYKCGNDNTLLRLTLLSVNAYKNNSKPDSTAINASAIGIGFNIGFEKRKSITDKLDFYYGLDLLTSFLSSSRNNIRYDDKTDNWTITAGPGFVLGLDFKINNAITLSAEVVPSLRYSYGETTNTSNSAETKQTNTGYNFGLNTTGANLTLAYRFRK